MRNRIQVQMPSRSARKRLGVTKPHGGAARRGQAMAEFAFILPLAMIVLIVSIQFAILGGAALSLNQLAYAGARYAAVNPNSNQAAISSYMKSIASPMIGEKGGANIGVTVTPSTAPRAFGTQVQVAVSYNLSSKLFLPNPFLGISFPTSISGVQTTMMNE